MLAKNNFIASFVCAVALVLGLSVAAFADTIRLKDGSVIKGKVVDFKNQQFKVVLSGASNRRSEMTIYMEDVESIEFDAPSAQPAGQVRVENQSANNQTANNSSNNPPITATPTPRPSPVPTPVSSANNNPPRQNGGISQVINSQPTVSTQNQTPNIQPENNGIANSGFIPLRIRVLADNTANGWTNSGLVVRKGQRIKISSTGKVSLGSGRYATPAGVGSIADSERLMKTEPTGALICVIGDDNNEFIFIGASREFEAPRDGTLFLGINEGNLADNSGVFDTLIEAEIGDATAQR